jgi:phosphate uptake regulator/aminoglycoside phosphotransferase
MLDEHDPKLQHKVTNRDNYIDHLRTIIDNNSFSFLREHGSLDKRLVDEIRARSVIASNLERIADHAVSVVGQTEHFTDVRFFRRYDYAPFFDTILDSLDQILPAFNERDASRAARICRSEGELDRLYHEKFERVLAEMQSGRDVANLVTSLFIFHYLERMGDCLQNIGEAIIFTRLGERVKFHEYESLRSSLAAARGRKPSAEEVGYEGIWGTRSGGRVGKVTEETESEQASPEVIYKEGDPDKIRLEKENIERWSMLVPGLPPRVVQYEEGESAAALLMEYLAGRTFQQIAVGDDPQLLDRCIAAVQRTLREVWLETKKDQRVQPRFLDQIGKRLEDIYNIHPTFRGFHQQIGGLAISSFEDLLERNKHVDDEVYAPFSVFAHGDFNLDNIIYDPRSDHVHFVDLHRSRDIDYVQDISVFLVSNFRVPVFEIPRRRQLNRIIVAFHDFAAGFAEEQGDKTFAARLALGLVRSFATSTRFEIDRSFAENMLRRALYLLERIEAHAARPWESFTLPQDVLLY